MEQRFLKLIVVGLVVDFVLFVAFWLSVPVRIDLFLFLAFLNLFFFFYLLVRVMFKIKQCETSKALPLEFVMCNSFMVASLALFNMVCELLREMCA